MSERIDPREARPGDVMSDRFGYWEVVRVEEMEGEPEYARIVDLGGAEHDYYLPTQRATRYSVPACIHCRSTDGETDCPSSPVGRHNLASVWPGDI